jgi:minor extracellular serine protease Vpr
MRFTPTRAAAALALAFGILGSSNSNAVQPQPFEGAADNIRPAWTPLGVSQKPVTVVLKLAGESVAERQGNAGRKLNRAEKDNIKSQLRGRQDALRGSIGALGGQVLASYQSAYNGMKVRVARDRVADLARLPGVVAVRPLQVFTPNNVRGLPLIGAPAVWQSLGLHGENVKIAVIDTGIDYTHATFAGPGTAAAFANAKASSTSPADPALFGPGAPRIKGGIDLVGDDYNASADPFLEDGTTPNPALVPQPDPNPLDCNGHGSHVAGTAAGSGVTASGATYTGPYDATTLANPAAFRVGPGVAPKADLYAVRVFGCAGSTDVTVDAIEWAVDNDMDVINMSLGAPFGSKDDPSAEASTNAARAGVIVVTSAGNSGPSQYITGSPGTADGAIATAANDPWQTIPGVRVQTTPPSGTGLNLSAINANGHEFSGPLAGALVVLQDNPATTTDEEGLLGSANESLGCSPAAYAFNGVVAGSGQIAVAQRGACARVAKAIFGQQAGAAAVIMTNNAAPLPPFEGPITANPDTGIPFTVTIPFVGVAGNQATTGTDSFRLRASPAGTTANLSPIDLANTNYTGFATFSSGGPRTGDSALKPDVTAPGVSIMSTGVGTGNAGALISGTSMASPHVAGVAALTRQAHPTWSVEDIKSAIVNTAQPSGVGGITPYRTSRGGAGQVQPAGSTATQVVAHVHNKKFSTSLNFGFAEVSNTFRHWREIVLRNHGSSAAIFNVSQANAAGSAHTVSFDKTSVRVPARGQASVKVTLNVPAATAGGSAAYREAAGVVLFTPATAADNAGVALRVPYLVVPRALSDVATTIGTLSGTNPSSVATVTNAGGAIAGDADFYAWGLASDPIPPAAEGEEAPRLASDVRAVGVQSFPFPNAANPTRRLLVFAVNTYNRWSNAATNEFDILVDVDGDGEHDYTIVGVDQGAVQLGSFNGIMGSFVFSERSPGASINFLASAPSDSSTALLPVLSTQLCRTAPLPDGTLEPCLSQASNPRFTYRAVSFDLLSGVRKEVAGSAKFNAWSSSISQGGFATVAPGATDMSNTISVNSAEWTLTPAQGVMVVTFDNKSGAPEAQLIPVTPE